MHPGEHPLEFAQAVLSQRAPSPIGPYSQAIRANGMMFCSGQVGLDPATGTLVGGGVAAQTQQALRNLTAVLEAGGSSLQMIVKTTIFLVDMNDFATVNAAYAAFFLHLAPARSTVAVAGLPLGASVEIEAIAVLE